MSGSGKRSRANTFGQPYEAAAESLSGDKLRKRMMGLGRELEKERKLLTKVRGLRESAAAGTETLEASGISGVTLSEENVRRWREHVDGRRHESELKHAGRIEKIEEELRRLENAARAPKPPPPKKGRRGKGPPDPTPAEELWRKLGDIDEDEEPLVTKRLRELAVPKGGRKTRVLTGRPGEFVIFGGGRYLA